jgi:hypothetical protein
MTMSKRKVVSQVTMVVMRPEMGRFVLRRAMHDQ